MMTTSVTEQDTEPFIPALAKDAVQFMHYNRQVIDEAPLQTYVSAIMFSPTRSRIRQIFFKQLLQWISSLPVVRDN
jgi:hypothetical protein